MSSIFNGCSLKELPDISQWNTSNVIDMSYMFNNCNNIVKLPDISKWDTQNVVYMNNMFCGCSNIKELPDISN